MSVLSPGVMRSATLEVGWDINRPTTFGSTVWSLASADAGPAGSSPAAAAMPFGVRRREPELEHGVGHAIMSERTVGGSGEGSSAVTSTTTFSGASWW